MKQLTKYINKLFPGLITRFNNLPPLYNNSIMKLNLFIFYSNLINYENLIMILTNT